MKTVVVVEDEPITRMDICAMLEDLGFSIAGEASDGFDAIELCRRIKPDVVLMDAKMPIFDGLSATETICREDLAGCVVMLTAFSDEEIVMRAAEAGVTGYLVKPIDRSMLLPTIEVAYAQSCKLRKSQIIAEKAQRKLREDRDIHKAQKLFAQMVNCTDTEAYEKMRKLAMNKRVSLYTIACAVLGQEDVLK